MFFSAVFHLFVCSGFEEATFRYYHGPPICGMMGVITFRDRPFIRYKEIGGTLLTLISDDSRILVSKIIN